MKCTVTVKTATDHRFGAMSALISTVQLVLKEMDRNAKLRATSWTTNIHQQSSSLDHRKHMEIHYHIPGVPEKTPDI